MAERLEAVGLATAHVCLVGLAGVLALHATGSLGPALEPLGTGTGLALFGILWVVALATHHRGIDPASLRGPSGWAWVDLLAAGFAWGAITGAGFFWAIAALGLGSVLLGDPTAVADIASVTTLLLGLIGTAMSLLVGGMIGVLAAMIDAGTFTVAQRISQSARSP